MRLLDKVLFAYLIVLAVVSGSIYFSGMIRLVLP